MTLKQQYADTAIMCTLAPPTVSECNATVVNTNNLSNNLLNVMRVLPISVMSVFTHYGMTNVCVENLYVDVNVYLTL